MRTIDLVTSRLARQRLTSEPLDSPVAVVGELLAVQAQEYEESKWSLSQRSGDPDAEAIEDLITSGRIIRTHVLRPTWHYVLPADLGWLQRLTGPRVHVANRGSYKRVGLDADDLRRTDETIAATLSDGEPRTRRELGAALEAAGFADTAKGERLTHAVMHAELECLIASGPRRGRQFTYLPVAERLRDPGALVGDAALAELARRYFGSHGPARAIDFSWWSGLTLRQARHALELAAGELTRIGADDADPGGWWRGPSPDPPASRGGALMLGSFDESHIAYREPRTVAPAALRLGFDFERPVLVDGRVAGSWRRVLARDRVAVTFTPIEPAAASLDAAVREEAARLARFQGLELEFTAAEPRIEWRR